MHGHKDPPLVLPAGTQLPAEVAISEQVSIATFTP